MSKLDYNPFLCNDCQQHGYCRNLHPQRKYQSLDRNPEHRPSLKELRAMMNARKRPILNPESAYVQEHQMPVLPPMHKPKPTRVRPTPALHY